MVSVTAMVSVTVLLVAPMLHSQPPPTPALPVRSECGRTPVVAPNLAVVVIDTEHAI